MKVDIIAKSEFMQFERNVNLLLYDIKQEFKRMRDLIIQMQDRIKLLEFKNGIQN